MNEQSSPQTPEFPVGPCRHGKVYVMDTDGYLNDDGSVQRVVIMSEQSWNEFGTRLEQMRRIMASQDERIKELLATVAARDVLNAQAMERLNNLREVRRKELASRIEGDLILPGDEAFNSTQRKQS